MKDLYFNYNTPATRLNSSFKITSLGCNYRLYSSIFILTVLFGIYFYPFLYVLSYGAANLTYCSESTSNMLIFLPFNFLNKLNTIANGAKASSLFKTLELRFKSYAFNYIVLELVPKLIVPTRYINLYLRSINIITDILEKRDLCYVLMGKRLNHSLYCELINYIANFKFLNYIFISICLISITFFPGYIPEWAISCAINSISGEILYFLFNSDYRYRYLNFKYLFILVIVSSYLLFALNVNSICIFTHLIMIFTLIIGIFIVIYILLYINLIDKEFKNYHPVLYYVINILGILLLLYFFVLLIDEIKEFICYINKSSGSKGGVSGKGVGNSSSSDRGGNPNPEGGGPNTGGHKPESSKKRKRTDSPEQKATRSAQAKEKRVTDLATMTPEENERRKAENREKDAIRRANLTPEQKERNKERARNKLEIPGAREKHNEKNRVNYSIRQDTMSDEKLAIYKEKERIRKSRKVPSDPEAKKEYFKQKYVEEKLRMTEEQLEKKGKRDRLTNAMKKGKVNPKDPQDLLKWQEEDAIKTEKRKTKREANKEYFYG